MSLKPRIPTIICSGLQVPELGKFSFSVNYRGTRRSALLVRFKGVVYSYLNQCVHMPKPLDCERSHIFDESGRYLQCSMHSICYDPANGESISEICAGKKLTALKVREDGGVVYLVEKRSFLVNSGTL